MRVFKTLFVISIFLIPPLANGQETGIGQSAPNLTFDLVNGDKELVSTKALKGKIVLLDFWATWCGPCITSMPHLDSLQKAFPNKLQVMAVTMEKPERIERFIKKRPYSFLYAIDARGKSQEVFPYRKIPHSVLIDQQGKVVAITRPQNITKAVIQQVLRNRPIDLPLKKDNTAFNFTDDYFEADESTIESFVMQPGNPAIPAFTKKYPRGTFGNRRISMHGITIAGLYREAYQMSEFRMLYEVDKTMFDYKKIENQFNVDIIVAPDSTEYLRKTLRRKLNETLDIKASPTKGEQEVAVLYKLDDVDFPLRPATKKTHYSARGDSFSGEGVSLDQFREYLENHGVLGMAVVNETGIEGIYSINFSYYSEDQKSFFKALKELGLGIKKETRSIDMLTIYKEGANDLQRRW